MARKRISVLLLLLVSLLLALGAAACGGGDDGADTGAAGQEDEGEGEAQRGGTFKSQIDAFVWTGNFDPTGEYLAQYWGMYQNLLGRALMGYRHVEGDEGNEVIPDLADGEPEISEDGLTYTFKIREGVKFSPPVDRDVTSKDIEYAFKRIATSALAAQYGFYYNGIVKGLAEYGEAGGLSKPANANKPIEGIETPDDQTIVFTLEEPTGDFLYRLAMPATAPIPEEVAKCFMKAGEYGRYVISSGPYMIEGSADLDISSCNAMKPLPGFNPNQHVRLERNPNYDPATDSEEVRGNYFDRFEMTLNTNPQDIFNRVKNGEIHLAYASEPPEVLREYTQSDELKDRYKQAPGDRTWYITMNLTQPPFDDIHVRKAMNWIMDKEGLRRAWGGSVKGEIAQHIVPDSMFNDELADYAPYATEGDAGDEEKAKEEMKQSKYDTDGDGVCDAPECKNLLHVTRNTDVWQNMVPVIEQSAAKIGIELTTREFEDSYTVIQTVKRQVPISSTAGWGKDYADPSTFMVLFDSETIIPEGNVNYSLVGLTPEQAQRVGAEGTVEGIPSVDEDIANCTELQDDERMQCWMDLDRKLMEEIVPWVPYLDQYTDFVVSDGLTKWQFDQFSGDPAWAHLAVDPAS